MSKQEGYGYEWDAILNGGPADGCVDRVIQINGNKPPQTVIRIVDGKEMERETLSEKLIEHLTKPHIDGNQRVAVYKLKEVSEGSDICLYDYVETISMGNFRLKYEVQ